MTTENPHPKRVSYPPTTEAPRGAGETFDLVVRKGPITLDEMMEQNYSFSRDRMSEHLHWLETHQFVNSEYGDMEEHGTTKTDYIDVHGTTRAVFTVHPSRVSDQNAE